MKDLNPAVYILALNSGKGINKELDIINQALNLNAKEVKGCYKGELENSYVILADETTRKAVLALAKVYAQESVLYLDATRNATLLRPACFSPPKYIGQFISVPKVVALEQENYTYDPNTDKYYIIRGGA